jgi:hypothetical protein
MTLNLEPPEQSATRVSTACVIQDGVVTHVLSPITGEGNIVQPQGLLVPIHTSIKTVVAQAGTFTALHISVSTTSFHQEGDMHARTCAFDQDVAWTLAALDRHAADWNSIRSALGHRGEWVPSGRESVAP